MRIGITVSEFNQDITSEMLKVAREKARKLKIKIVKVIKVPGAFDIPLAVKKLLKLNEIEGVAALGCIIKGGTSHDQIIAFSTSQKLADLSLEFEKPVTLGIMGHNISKEQAMERIHHYAENAIESLLKIKEAFNDQ